MAKKLKRSSQALRDVLFEEIEELRSGNGDPQRAMAVSNLAKQIINVAKVELDFHRLKIQHIEAGHSLDMGQMQLGSQRVAPVDESAMDESSHTMPVQ